VVHIVRVPIIVLAVSEVTRREIVERRVERAAQVLCRSPTAGVLGLVLTVGNVEVIAAEAAGTVADEDERAPIRSGQGAVVGSGGVDVGAEVYRRPPGKIPTEPAGDPDVEGAETAGAIRSKVKTETSL
jgi:hypothetical protein